MDYTQSDAYVTDGGTGNRMHQSTAPITTELSSSDMNSVIWELLELIKSADIVPLTFNKGVPGTYTQVRDAIELLIQNQAEAIVATYSAPSGSNELGFSPPGFGAIPTTVEAELRRTVWIDNYATLADAINALPASGGVVNIPIGRFLAGNWNYDVNYMSKANVTLRGTKMPTFSANCDRLEGGSVIVGRFNVFADNFHHENLGYDLGKYVMDTYYPTFDSHTANHPNGYTWDAFAFAQPNQVAPAAARRGYVARNVVGLLRDSQSYGHAMLQEGFDGGAIDNSIGMYGIHANVIKAKNVRVGFIAGYGASTDHVILKSDTYAEGGGISIDMLDVDKAPPGTIPWSVPAACSYGLLINPATNNMTGIKIGKARVRGAACLLGAQGSGASWLDNVMIGELEIEGAGMASPIAMNFGNANFYRIKLGRVTINNVADGIAYSNNSDGFGSDPMVIHSLSFDSVSLRAIQALSYGRLVITHLRTRGVINTMYAIADTARVHVGREEFASPPTTKWGLNPPALTAGWQQFPGNSAFGIDLHNYGATVRGLLQPVSGGSGHVVAVPPYLACVESIRMLTYAQGTGAIDKALLVNVGGGSGYIDINDGLDAIGAENYLSLDGVQYRLD